MALPKENFVGHQSRPECVFFHTSYRISIWIVRKWKALLFCLETWAVNRRGSRMAKTLPKSCPHMLLIRDIWIKTGESLFCTYQNGKKLEGKVMPVGQDDGELWEVVYTANVNWWAILERIPVPWPRSPRNLPEKFSQSHNRAHTIHHCVMCGGGELRHSRDPSLGEDGWYSMQHVELN